MLWVVTLSLFLPSFTSSCVVCAHPSAGQELSNAAHSKIFFMTSSQDCACDRLLHYIKDPKRSRAPPLGLSPMGSPWLRNGLNQGPIAISLPMLSCYPTRNRK